MFVHPMRSVVVQLGVESQQTTEVTWPESIFVNTNNDAFRTKMSIVLEESIMKQSVGDVRVVGFDSWTISHFQGPVH